MALIDIFYICLRYIFRDTQWVSSFIAPFITLRYPAVIWGSLINGFTLGWAIIIQLVFADFFPVLYDFSGYAIGNIGYAVSFARNVLEYGLIVFPGSYWCRYWLPTRGNGQ